MLSDKYMLSLWRSAVLIVYCHRCAFCGKKGDDVLQAHHIVRRKHKITRYLPLNGLPLCHKCHSLAHTKAGEQKIMVILGKSYDKLVEMEQISYKQYLQDNGMTESEFMSRSAEELKSIIGGE
jgi:predicted restriction endonuclease